MATFNSKEYTWTNIKVFMFGRFVTTIRGIKYKASQEKEAVYGQGDKPIAIQPGNKSFEGELQCLQSDLEAMQVAAGNGNDILDIPAFDIQVQYVDKVTGTLVVDTVKYAEFTEVEKGMSQGDKFMEISLPWIALDIQKNV